MKEELMKTLEEAIEEEIEVFNNTTTGSPEREKEAKNLKYLTDCLNELKQTDDEIWDREERRRIEELKNEKNAKIEEMKAMKGWKDKMHDIFLLICKGSIATIGQLALLKVLIEFEEKGTLRSKASRDFHIMNPLSWIK